MSDERGFTNHPHRDDPPPSLFAQIQSLFGNGNSATHDKLHEIKALLRAISSDEAKILSLLEAKQPKATRIVLEVPTVTRKGKIMNYELKNDTIATIGIKTTDAAGAVVPSPVGDTFTVSSGNPASLGAALGADASGNPAIVLTPLVRASPNVVVTVSDSSGLPNVTLIVDIVQDVTPTNVILDTADATLAPQPVPAAPGP